MSSSPALVARIRRWAAPALAGSLALAAVLLARVLRPSQHVAIARIELALPHGVVDRRALPGRALLETHNRLLLSGVVLDPALHRLGRLPRRPSERGRAREDLASGLTVTSVPGTLLVELRLQHPSGDEALRRLIAVQEEVLPFSDRFLQARSIRRGRLEAELAKLQAGWLDCQERLESLESGAGGAERARLVALGEALGQESEELRLEQVEVEARALFLAGRLARVGTCRDILDLLRSPDLPDDLVHRRKEILLLRSQVRHLALSVTRRTGRPRARLADSRQRLRAAERMARAALERRIESDRARAVERVVGLSARVRRADQQRERIRGGLERGAEAAGAAADAEAEGLWWRQELRRVQEGLEALRTSSQSPGGARAIEPPHLSPTTAGSIPPLQGLALVLLATAGGLVLGRLQEDMDPTMTRPGDGGAMELDGLPVYECLVEAEEGAASPMLREALEAHPAAGRVRTLLVVAGGGQSDGLGPAVARHLATRQQQVLLVPLVQPRVLVIPEGPLGSGRPPVAGFGGRSGNGSWGALPGAAPGVWTWASATGAGALSSAQLREAAARYDRVVIEVRPGRALVDLARLVDGVFVACQAGRTREGAVRRLTERVRACGGRLVGVLLS